MIPEDKSYAYSFISDTNYERMMTFIYILFIVGIGFACVLTIIIFFALRTANRITKNIDVMTKFTNELKRATDITKKRNIIESMGENELFKKVSK